MADLGNFDAEQVEPSGTFDLMPKGWVEAMVIESERKQTNAGDGSYIKIVYQILDQRAEYKGRKMWLNLNLENQNPEAVQIARGQLSSMCRAVGILKPKDSSELHNLPHMILVGQRARKDTGEMQNVINGWKPKGGTSAPQLSQAQKETDKMPVPKPQPAGTTSAPWLKKAQ